MGQLRNFLGEKRLIKWPFIPSFPSIRRLPGLLLISLFVSLPFVFRLLQLHEQKMHLKGELKSIDLQIELEAVRNLKLKKEIIYLKDPRFLEVKIMERLGVVPRGSKVINFELDLEKAPP